MTARRAGAFLEYHRATVDDVHRARTLELIASGADEVEQHWRAYLSMSVIAWQPTATTTSTS